MDRDYNHITDYINNRTWGIDYSDSTWYQDHRITTAKDDYASKIDETLIERLSKMAEDAIAKKEAAGRQHENRTKPDTECSDTLSEIINAI